jgi:hypothetical protein
MTKSHRRSHPAGELADVPRRHDVGVAAADRTIAAGNGR